MQNILTESNHRRGYICPVYLTNLIILKVYTVVVKQRTPYGHVSIHRAGRVSLIMKINNKVVAIRVYQIIYCSLALFRAFKCKQ